MDWNGDHSWDLPVRIRNFIIVSTIIFWLFDFSRYRFNRDTYCFLYEGEETVRPGGINWSRVKYLVVYCLFWNDHV